MFLFFVLNQDQITRLRTEVSALKEREDSLKLQVSLLDVYTAREQENVNQYLLILLSSDWDSSAYENFEFWPSKARKIFKSTVESLKLLVEIEGKYVMFD